MINFKDKYTFEVRKNESTRILNKYKDKIPVIIQNKRVIDSYISSMFHKSIPDIDKTKFLIPFELTVGQFIYIIRKRLKLSPEKSIFIYFINSENKSIITPNCYNMKQVYDENKDDDLFLYAYYIGENTFG